MVGLVDGVFRHGTAISPNEVLRAVDRGVLVLGSSSMGALRAAECAPFGMVGVGRVYEAYASGEVDADDEVAMTYDRESLRPMSEAMINLRFGIAAAVSAGVVDAGLADRFLAVAKGLHYPQRSLAAVLARLAREVDAGSCAAVRRFFVELAPNVRRDDARQLLMEVRRAVAREQEPERSSVRGPDG
ncbi:MULTISPECIES: TfuA-like protein [unclassified Micromonospora]|uniref:TfuA-like protein n=1 Tax=unclassified Micromonospora TaxID=2617518 RepID=UPI0033281BE5